MFYTQYSIMLTWACAGTSHTHDATSLIKPSKLRLVKHRGSKILMSHFDMSSQHRLMPNQSQELIEAKEMMSILFYNASHLKLRNAHNKRMLLLGCFRKAIRYIIVLEVFVCATKMYTAIDLVSNLSSYTRACILTTW